MDRASFTDRYSLVASRWLVAGLCVCASAVLVVVNERASAEPDSNQSWRQVTGASGNPSARHESAGASVDGKFYLIGGRGSRPVDVYDPESDSWSEAADAPITFHHFQAAVVGTDIYVIGSFIGGYPKETSVAEIHVFDTVDDEWSIEGSMPANRVRGSAATAVKDGWIYVVGGNTQGHNGGAVPWFDRYKPSTGEWEILPDAPEARDHHGAAWVGDALVTSGGRRSVQPNPFVNTIGPTDVWQNGSWTSRASIPTERAGALTLGFGQELIVAGGETESDAEAAVEAFNVATGTWRNLQDMNQKRHSGGAALIGTTWHVVSGATGRGNAGETESHETLELGPIDSPDSDNDGLTDEEEVDDYGTDPEDFDTDNDQLSDGEEAVLGTDPLSQDTDEDGLDDHAETLEGTDPLEADSDDDGLEDDDEIERGTDPLEADSDDDGLEDGEEIELGTDPLLADTDEDELQDGFEVLDSGTDPLLADTDFDQLDDATELNIWGTNPLLADSDLDGLEDLQEIGNGTNPSRADSDADGLDDGLELDIGFDPLAADADQDGWLDGVEYAAGTDPDSADTDGDGILDSGDPEPLGDLSPDGGTDTAATDTAGDGAGAQTTGGGGGGGYQGPFSLLLMVFALLGRRRLLRLQP